ncbi:MAG: S8 family serine peptidase [Kofleriaceae bacterium]
MGSDPEPASTETTGPASAAASRFTRSPILGPIRTTVLPRAIDPTPMTVVVFLSGPSVADLQEAAQHKLPRAEKDAVKAQRVAEQVAPRANITAMGGKVIGSFQSALNGLKVVIPRNQLDALRAIPGVVDIKPVATYTHENFVGVQRIQAPFAWAGAAGVHGEGVKVAIIDTGIDYTHANFGGPGTTDAFNTAFASNTQPADPALFGATAPKVKGGTDLVGDNYDANGTGDALIPVPDVNPLDCNGHGSHVAGTVAGYGVLADGTTYHGTYDQVTHATHSFGIGPGVAPLADLYAVRVFGCTGSTDVVAEAIEWAVDNDMDVINMSLGAAFGTADSADAVAADKATAAGVVVVSAAGNDGNFDYILSSPGASTRSIAVASTARQASIATADLALAAVAGDAARTINAINANGAPLTNGALQTVVLRTATGAVSLGCDPAEYVNVTGKLVVVARGTCARVARAIFGQQAGAAAVVMINNTAAQPQFEGQITVNPDTGVPFVVTIPFLGVAGPAANAASDGGKLALRDGTTTTVTNGTPIRTGTSSFSSGGPRIGDSALKPEIAAPGEGIVSTAMGTGTGGEALSGTSMATPHVAGTAALGIQAHRTWKPGAIKSAIINSGNPDELVDYQTRRVGTGLVNAGAVAGTLAYAYADHDQTSLNFGFKEFSTDFTAHKLVHVFNDALTSVTFNVSVDHQNGSPHQVTTSAQQLTIPPRGDRTVDVTITVPAATAGNSDAFRDAAGLITFTPATAATNRGFSLRVPYYLVPRVASNVITDVPVLRGSMNPTTFASVSNNDSAIAATADFYAWGLTSPNTKLGRIDVRAAGAQSFDSPDGKTIVFAINTYFGWSTAFTQEFDVLVDADGDGIDDFAVFSTDLGLFSGGARTGQLAAAIVDLKTNVRTVDFLALAPTDASTILLPVLASSIGVTEANPRFSYNSVAFDTLSTAQDAFTAPAKFNAFTNALSTGQFVSLAPNETAPVQVSADRIESMQSPALGLLVITQDNRNGPFEAQTIKVKF